VIRRRIVCRGTVQGVGFRPAVYRLASSLRLGGLVLNSPEGVIIEVEGPSSAVEAFVDRLPRSLPALADLRDVDVSPVTPRGDDGFAVQPSEPGREVRGSLPPDTVLCPDCRAEMQDPDDRRYAYPFTTCTNCGPRFSVVTHLPYDRERTSMACFPLCPECAAEYGQPADRRFHAEPLCCPACGPRLWLTDAEGETTAEGAGALGAARDALRQGKIVAVKGLGGFQLACRADRADAVARLRERKRRPVKPFAVMARDLASARTLVCLRGGDEEHLASARGPILLAPRREGSPIAPEIAPGLTDLGVMLPTTPLHVELMAEEDGPPLVMTSGNVTDEPIACGNREALGRLGAIADLFLLHNRDVVRRLDDSVMRSSKEGCFLVRRSRGWVPMPLPLPVASPHPILAMGGHLQATTALAVGEEAILSQHVGDLDGDAARQFLLEAASGIEELMQAQGAAIAIDLHADYPSTWMGEELARSRGVPCYRIQHHLAHAAATLAEHHVFPDTDERVGAIILDGVGWGADGAPWGGEWLELDGSLTWRRRAHLEPMPLVGGERAVREPWRVLVGALATADQVDLLPPLPVGEAELQGVARLARHRRWPQATGAGRLFEAAGALLGLTAANRYEGEAAARLESLAASAPEAGPWPEATIDGPLLPGGALLVAAARRLRDGVPPAEVARAFHETFTRRATELATRVFAGRVTRIALGGGCLVNRLLRRRLGCKLREAGFEPFLPVRVPPGDGGLSYGQVVLASIAMRRGAELRME